VAKFSVPLQNQIAQDTGVTPAQVSLRWLANRPGVIAPICGARTVKQVKENLGMVNVTLSDDATRMLEDVSRPVSGGYPYGAFGQWQRERWMQDGSPAPVPVVAAGSLHPLGKK